MRRVFASLLFLLFISSALMAYQLSPLNVTYAPSGADSAKVYTITNDSDSPVAIEVRAEQRIIDIDGNEVNQDGSAYFSIQPSRMIIPGNTTQLVRVQYRGPQTVTSESSTADLRPSPVRCLSGSFPNRFRCHRVHRTRKQVR